MWSAQLLTFEEFRLAFWIICHPPQLFGFCPAWTELQGLAATSNYFLFAFCKNGIDLPGSQINGPSLERTQFSFVPSSNYIFIDPKPLEGFLSWYGPLKDPRILLSEVQVCKENRQLCCAWRRDPRTLSKNSHKPWQCVCKNTPLLLAFSLKVLKESDWVRIW